MLKRTILISLLALTTLTFSACCDKPKIVEKIVYIKAKCPKLEPLKFDDLTDYSDLNITYEVLNEKD